MCVRTRVKPPFSQLLQKDTLKSLYIYYNKEQITTRQAGYVGDHHFCLLLFRSLSVSLSLSPVSLSLSPVVLLKFHLSFTSLHLSLSLFTLSSSLSQMGWFPLYAAVNAGRTQVCFTLPSLSSCDAPSPLPHSLLSHFIYSFSLPFSLTSNPPTHTDCGNDAQIWS